MRAASILLAIVLLPFVSYAEEYCQPPDLPPPGDPPPIAELVSDAAAVADELLGSMECGYVNGGTWYLSTSLAGPPDALIWQFHYEACPPAVDQGFIVITRQWGDLNVSVVSSGGWGQLWAIQVEFSEDVHIEGLTSIGLGASGGPGGYGVVETVQGDVQGCAGYVRPAPGEWTSLVDRDVAFCITYGQPTPVGEWTWGKVKSLYR